MKQTGFLAEELAQFRDVQRLAYACTEDVALELQAGMTEREVAARMLYWLEEHDVHTYFHRPFAWFGDRSALRGMGREHTFFPTERRLEPGMTAILDVAPIVGGYMADVAYTTSLGDDPLHARMCDDLLECRALILEGARARRSFRDIYRALDAWIAQRGYENAHRVYPERVLAHRLVRLPKERVSRLHLWGFGFDQYRWLVAGAARARFLPGRYESPLWNDGPESAHAPLPGLWAVEPHVACGDVGAKWEEILVITENDAFWLDDEVPHVRRGERRRRAREASERMVVAAVPETAAPAV